MSIREIHFQSLYRKKDNVLNSFYIPSLSKAKVYKRVSAYFCSDVLKLYAKGLSSFVNKNGKIYFIFSHHISEEDYQMIKNGYDGRFNQELLTSIQDLDDSVQISNLAYLIASGIVEIKIGFVTPGTLHFKYGLIEDGNDIVCFRGSTNETPAGLLLNGENFEVSCSWLCGEHDLETIKGYEQEFDDLWNNKYDGVITVNAPKCVVQEVEKHSKNSLILDYEDESTNSFIFDFDENYKLVGYSFLNNKKLLAPTTLWFKTTINYAVDEIDNLSIFHFNVTLPAEIKLLIERFKNYAETNNFSVKVSSRVNEFIQNAEMYIDKRVSLGNAIKSKDSFVLQEFEQFKEIVNNQLVRELKEPQMWDAFHATKMIAACNFSVPGTGKTTVAYGVFGYLSSKPELGIKRIVMIGPKNSFMAWKNEFVACFGNKKELKCFNIQNHNYKNSNQRISALMQEYENSNLVLINYDALQNNRILDALKMMMRKDKFSSYLVLDEAHKIKGYQGKRAGAVLSLSPFAKYKLVLTGTPIPNSYLDVYNVLNILYNNDYSNFFGYTPEYLTRADYIPSMEEEINTRIYPFFCRTSKDDLKIPQATFDYDSLYVKMNEKEQKLFSLVHEYFGYNTLVLYIRLLQASINPSVILERIKDEDLGDIFSDYDDDSDDFVGFDLILEKNNLSKNEKKHSVQFSKDDEEFIRNFSYTRKFYKGIDKVFELAKQGKKVVVWGVFVSTLNSIESALESKGINSIVISGSMPLDEREKNINRFINGEFDVLISNPHTLAESISLHTICHDAVYFEYTFNLTHMLQSRDRIHRLGLPDGTITTYYFAAIDGDDLLDNSVDVRTLERLKMKEDRMIRAVETEQLFVKGESFEEDINFIFGLDK